LSPGSRCYPSKKILDIFLKMNIFLFRKMTEFRKMPTEREMIEKLRRGQVSLPPLSFRLLKSEVKSGQNRRIDALVEVSWGKSKAKFAVECKSLSTPKAFQDGLSRLKTWPLPKGYRPLLFAPFFSERQLWELEQEGISGVDLCGNGVVVVPNVLSVFRSGAPTLFSLSAPIKNIYRKNSSMVGRVFLLRPDYPSVQDVCSEINRQNTLVSLWDRKPMSLSTVSKALKTLEEDLLVSRNDSIRVLQPDRLLEKLSENYVPPKVGDRVRLKTKDESGIVQGLLLKLSQELELPIVATGTSSVSQYAVMQRGDLLSVYCPRLEPMLERIPGIREDRFPNLELVETEDETVYFDVRQEGDFRWASPVQVYVELMAGDKRDRETAEQVKSLLLENLERERE
jgi:hypothetical protein